MRIPLEWLAEYVDLGLSVEELAERLTLAGVETRPSTGSAEEGWEGIVVGLVTGLAPHPKADRLQLATVESGAGAPLTVVCGAPNVVVGQKVALAREGAELVDARSGARRRLQKARIRGVESAGMVCSERELGLSEEHEGILVLAASARVGQPLAEALGQSALEVQPTPNRPDHLAVLGIAREVAALTGAAVREPARTVRVEGPPVAERTSVTVADPDLCPRYIATVVTGVTVGPSPEWLQRRLEAAGQRPINNVVDVTNYVMLELGQPLHAFDFERLRGGRIVVRRARAGERLRLIDGSERTLSTEMLVIADAEEAVAVAGVMGGGASEVTATTTTVLVESATFEGANIRRTAVALKQRTEASARFEKGLAPALALAASERATALLAEVAGGTADAGRADVFPGQASLPRVELTLARLEQVLGLAVTGEEMRAILGRLGFGVRETAAGRYEVETPYWRSDVRIADDVVEEVARVLGYGQIPSAPLRGAVGKPERAPLLEAREALRDALAAGGLHEVISYVATSKAAVERVQPAASLEGAPLRLFNPLSQERDELRRSLRAGLLESFGANAGERRGALGLFEVGKVFFARGEELPEERTLAAALVGGVVAGSLQGGAARALDFFDAKALAEGAAAALGLHFEYAASAQPDPALEPGASATVSVAGRPVGALGEVAAAVWERFGIEGPLFLLELDVGALSEAERAPPRGGGLSRFPALREDLAVVVEEAVPAGAVEAVLLRPGLVERAELFDVYVGPQIPAGKKSLAYALTYRAPDRTLTDAEVAAVRAGIVGELEQELGASIREG